MSRTHFPHNIYKADFVEPLPYYRRDVINPKTHFEFIIPSNGRQVDTNTMSRYGYSNFPSSKYSTGYGHGNLVGFFNSPQECDQDPPGFVSKKTAEIIAFYK